MKTKTIKKIVDKIKHGKSFLITAHMNLEGDALGSQLGMYLLLKKLKKKVVIYDHDRVPEIYKFLPSIRVIKNEPVSGKFDVALVLDCSDSSRTGKVKDSLSSADLIINIDHHISNTYFGDINWVEPFSSSASEMVYQLCEKFKVIDKNIALCLYTGIHTDTGSFNYASTSSHTHRVISKLMEYPIRPDVVYEKLHSLCVPSDLDFIGKIISSLKFDPAGKICWAKMTDWKDKNYDLNEIVFNTMRLIKDIEVLILFKKVAANRTRVNFRSRSRIDVNQIAKFFSGGGHKRASGATLDDNLIQAEKKVISYVRRYTDRLKK